MSYYTVQQGDCILSIAASNGFLWDTIWNDPNNADLKQRRKGNPNVLLPGDMVYIPEKTLRVENKPTDQRHDFVKSVGLAEVRLRLLDLKRQPRAAVNYTATVDGVTTSGTSDSDGYVALQVPPTASELKLTVTEEDRIDNYTLPLGHIDPIDSLTGVQQRLANLGYPCESEMGTLGELTKNALRALQMERNLTVTGEIDDATRQQLKLMHGC